MAFHLKNSSLSQSKHLSNFIAGNGGQITSRGQGIQGKQVHGTSVPVCFLLNSFIHSSLHCAHCQIPFILPHPPSHSHLQKSLPLVSTRNSVVGFNPKNLSYCLNKFRPFCANVGSTRCDSEYERNGERESKFGDNVEFEAEVERVCKVIDETFALDRNMEAVLDECRINLSHELVLGVLRRFKHARKPAFRFFSWAAERPGFAHDLRTYNSMVEILGKTRQFETMMSILEEMGHKGLLLMETFSICIRAFAAAKEREKALGVLDTMKKYMFKIDVETVNYLLDALGRAKLGKEAQALFDKIKHKFTPNLKTYTVLLNGWCEVKDMFEAGRIWNKMVDNGFKPDIVAHNIMLEGLLRSRKQPNAITFFELMKSKGSFPNVRSYTILINYLCKQGYTDEAMTYLDDMVTSGLSPDAFVYTCLIIGFGNKGKMDMVYRLLKEMNEKGCPLDGRTYNALIKMMVNQKKPDDAVKMYKKMIRSGIEPSIHTYNMIIKAYFVARNYDMGCAIWEEMKRTGCCPDGNSYVVLIGGLVRLRRPNEACKYLQEMIDKGMKPPDFGVVEDFGQEIKFSGSSAVADLFARWLR